MRRAAALRKSVYHGAGEVRLKRHESHIFRLRDDAQVCTCRSSLDGPRHPTVLARGIRFERVACQRLELELKKLGHAHLIVRKTPAHLRPLVGKQTMCTTLLRVFIG